MNLSFNIKMKTFLLCLFLLSSLCEAYASPSGDSLKTYENLHQAFFKYDQKKILTLAKDLSDSLKKIEDEKVQKQLEKDNLYKYLESFSKAQNREIQNSLLNSISKKLFDILIEGDKENKEYSLYYCPMVKKYWLQNTIKISEVQNPYAPEMPNCGSKK